GEGAVAGGPPGPGRAVGARGAGATGRRMMRPALTGLFVYGIVMMLAFAVLHGLSRRPTDRGANRIWWQLLAMALVDAVELVVLLLVLYRVQWPWQALVAVYAAVDVVKTRWVWLKWL